MVEHKCCSKFKKVSLVLLRVSFGWLFFYAGLSKILNPDWSAAGYLGGAKTFGSFYNLFLGDSILPIINFINEWGLTLLGVSLILGLFVRPAALFGAALMILYYFPVLEFPRIMPHSYLVDDHIIYALVLVFLAAIGAGHVWGLDKLWAKLLKKT